MFDCKWEADIGVFVNERAKSCHKRTFESVRIIMHTRTGIFVGPMNQVLILNLRDSLVSILLTGGFSNIFQ